MKTYSAKTLEELLALAAQEKGVEVEALTYFVTETKTGFLGLGASVTADVYADSDVTDFVTTYLATFFEGLDLAVKINVQVADSKITVDVNADNNAILIGKNGSSLGGLNNLLRSVVNAKFKRRFYVALDINGYKESRYLKLKDMARRIAKTVQRTKVTATLDPMSNDERRVIHKELSGYPNIKTQSEGLGRQRHLTVVYVGNTKE